MNRDGYDRFYANPFLPLKVPHKDWLLAIGLWPDQIKAHQAACRDQIAARNDFLAKKPSGCHEAKAAEDSFYDQFDGPILASFSPDACPSGVSYVDYLKSIPDLVMRLVNQVYAATQRRPTCGLVDAGVASFLDASCVRSTDRFPPPVPAGHWRESIGKFFKSVDVHREPDCVEPYLLPRGELWLMMAWRYDRPS